VIARLVPLVAGMLFAAGACLSGMVRPSKVLAFLDVGNGWDPSLALVLGAGLAVHAVAWRIARPPRVPAFGECYPGAPSKTIDARLIIGSMLFGVGWGLGGFCPGPAVISTVSLVPGTLLFFGTMLAGMGLARTFAGADAPTPKPTTGDGA
jgi:uncharacterized protein